MTFLSWFLIALYFAPTVVAVIRGREVVAIGVLNLLLGWTIVGWVGALVWAVSGKSADDKVSPAPPSRPVPEASPKPLATPEQAALFRNSPAQLEQQAGRISSRVFRRASGLGLSMGIGDDDGDADFERGRPTEPAIAHLDYTDAQGSASKRLVTIRRVNRQGTFGGTITAHCHMRRAARSFRIDRINSLTDVTTGEVLDTPTTIADWLSARTPTDFAAALDGLTVLSFVAAADDHLADEEVAIMARYAAGAAPGVSIPPDFAARLARFAPTPEAVLSALLAVSQRGGADALTAALTEIIQADNEIHPSEREAVRFLKMTLDES
jgi:hypothetical protein